MKTVSFRFPEPIVRALEEQARRRGRPPSTLVREAVSAYLSAAERASPSLREQLEALVTWPGSGKKNLARDGEKILRERFHARRRSR
jgi:Arc/MetJ-type ribon-helix-helix transcriptional regulator